MDCLWERKEIHNPRDMLDNGIYMSGWDKNKAWQCMCMKRPH